jgi:hypothetical protein
MAPQPSPAAVGCGYSASTPSAFGSCPAAGGACCGGAAPPSAAACPFCSLARAPIWRSSAPPLRVPRRVALPPPRLWPRLRLLRFLPLLQRGQLPRLRRRWAPRGRARPVPTGCLRLLLLLPLPLRPLRFAIKSSKPTLRASVISYLPRCTGMHKCTRPTLLRCRRAN